MRQLSNRLARFHLFWRVMALVTRTKPRIEQCVAPRLKEAKRRVPFITANIITTFRAFPAWLAYALFTADAPYPKTAAAIYLVTALLDWLDGAWARANGENASKWGKVYDPLVDKMIVLGWLVFFAFQGMFSWGLLWAMFGLEAFSTAVYFVRIDRLEGANWFGGTKKVTQDICVLLAILGWPGLAVTALQTAIGFSVASSVVKAFQPRAAAQVAQQSAIR